MSICIEGCIILVFVDRWFILYLTELSIEVVPHWMADSEVAIAEGYSPHKQNGIRTFDTSVLHSTLSRGVRMKVLCWRSSRWSQALHRASSCGIAHYGCLMIGLPWYDWNPKLDAFCHGQDQDTWFKWHMAIMASINYQHKLRQAETETIIIVT